MDDGKLENPNVSHENESHDVTTWGKNNGSLSLERRVFMASCQDLMNEWEAEVLEAAIQMLTNPRLTARQLKRGLWLVS